MTARALLVLATVAAGVVGLAPAALADGVVLVADSTTFLANIDDDAGVCQARAKQIVADAAPREQAQEQAFHQRKQELEELAKTDPERAEREFQELQHNHRIEQYQTDRDLAACNDAADEVVNGPRDELDLTKLHLWSSTGGEVVIPANTHVFIKRANWEILRPGTNLSADELRHGVELGLEGTDVIRDSAVWDGRVTVRFGDASVTLKEAPLITQNDTQPVEQVFAADRSKDAPDFDKTLSDAVPGLRKLDLGNDKWMQDILEPMYETRDGHGMRVLLTSVDSMHRESSRAAFTQLAGPDVAAIHVEHAFDPKEKEGYNSLGNLETVPPTPGHPLGQIIVGGKPAPEVLTLLRSQGVQDPLVLDSTWLNVGHVDEFVQFVPGGPHGWRALVADPRAGMQILRDSGHPDQIMHGNLPPLQWPYDLYVDQRTTGEFVADKQFAATNERAAAAIDANIALLRKAGVADIVRVPVLYTYKDLVSYYMLKQQIERTPPGPDRDKLQQKLDSLTTSVAEIPNAVNGVSLNNGTYLTPKSYGPVVDGKDVFQEAVNKVLTGIGLHPQIVDDFLNLHMDDGELHCGTNTFRKVPI
jgi:protein-arginine deiminase